MYSLLLALIYLIFIGLGLPDTLLGAAWPSMQPTMAMPLSAAGTVSMIITGGTICACLLCPWLMRKVSTQALTLVSVALTAVGMLGFSFSTSFPVLCLWAVPYGLGAGAVDAALNNYVALHYTARHMSWLHCFWGLGAMLSPYLMSLAITHTSWAWGYRTVALIQCGIVAVILGTLWLWRVNGADDSKGTADDASPGLLGTFRIKGAPTLALGLFCYMAAEGTVMLWGSSYLTDVRGVSEDTAAALASLFILGITVGRLLSGFVSERLGDRRLILCGVGISLCGVVCLLLPLPGDASAVAGLVLLGLGCAPVFPCFMHCTPQIFGAGNSQSVICVLTAGAYLGSVSVPPLFGHLAGWIGLAFFPLYLVIFFALMAVVVNVTMRPGKA